MVTRIFRYCGFEDRCELVEESIGVEIITTTELGATEAGGGVADLIMESGAELVCLQWRTTGKYSHLRCLDCI